MADNFKKNVDKFDSREFMDMKSDREVIEQIALASEVIGERKLRKQLKSISEAYHKRRQSAFWLMGIAASLLLVAIFYFQFPSNQNGRFQEMQMNEPPRLLDSATYEADSVRHGFQIDSIKN